MNLIIAITIGYALGNIMTAYILGRLKGIDIREEGTKNVGASNAVVVMGWPYGVITWAVDILKAAIAVWIVQSIMPDMRDLQVIAGFSAVIGHLYPVILKFRGGKGASSIFGMMLGVNWKVAIIMAITLILITLITDYIALGTIAMFSIVLIYFIFWGYGFGPIAIASLFLALVIYKHRGNIDRILKGEELGLRATRKINKDRAKNK